MEVCASYSSRCVMEGNGEMEGDGEREGDGEIE